LPALEVGEVGLTSASNVGMKKALDIGGLDLDADVCRRF
jgi:hypothetical protein